MYQCNLKTKQSFKMVDFSSSKINLDGKHKQLIDLNKDQTLFEAEFTITPHTLDLNKKYEIAVVSQSVLDTDEISFKEVNGIYKGDVKQDDQSSEYENFFLVINSAVPIKELNVDVAMRPIKVKQQPVEVERPPVEQVPVHEEAERVIEKYEKKNNIGFWARNKVKIIICFFVLVAGGYLLYYFWKKNQNKNTNESPVLKALPQPALQVAPPVSERFSNMVKETTTVPTTEKLFNPFNRRKGRSPPSVASSGFSKSPGSDSGRSFVFEE
jgi:hypothetical protein